MQQLAIDAMSSYPFLPVLISRETRVAAMHRSSIEGDPEDLGRDQGQLSGWYFAADVPSRDPGWRLASKVTWLVWAVD